MIKNAANSLRRMLAEQISLHTPNFESRQIQICLLYIGGGMIIQTSGIGSRSRIGPAWVLISRRQRRMKLERISGAAQSFARSIQATQFFITRRTCKRSPLEAQRRGQTWSDVITWAARGTYARDAGIEPHARDGLYLGLEQHSRLKTPVTLDQIREQAVSINTRLRELEDVVSPPLYYPFERGTKRETRPLQGYLFKLPGFFLELFQDLARPVDVSQTERVGLLSVGTEYQKAIEDQAVAERDPFAVDPAIVERGIRGHAATQNQLAEAVAAAGMCPRSPTALEPNFDLAWTDGSTIWVAEVKSLTIDWILLIPNR